MDELGIVLPVGFLDPLPPEEPSALVTTEAQRSSTPNGSLVDQSCRPFWKAGEYEGSTGGDFDSPAGNSRLFIVSVDCSGVLTTSLHVEETKQMLCCFGLCISITSTREDN